MRATGSAGGGPEAASDVARRLPVVLAVAALVAPSWILFGLNPRGGLVGPLGTTAVLAALVVLAWWKPTVKLHVVRLFQRFLLNPPVRLLLGVGVLPIGLALLETTGRTSGQPRRTPVGNGRDGDTFWIIAEHGLDANYVKNIRVNPGVRIKCREGFRPRWRAGHAEVLEQDDPYARQRMLCRKNPLRVINSAVVRVMSTTPVTVRIQLAADQRR